MNIISYLVKDIPQDEHFNYHSRGEIDYRTIYYKDEPIYFWKIIHDSLYYIINYRLNIAKLIDFYNKKYRFENNKIDISIFDTTNHNPFKILFYKNDHIILSPSMAHISFELLNYLDNK
jgi:hypothetical protein